jgi:MFS family permease
LFDRIRRVDPGLWTHPNFQKLWLGTSISLLGSQFTGLAIPLLAVLLLGASPVDMGLLSSAPYIPFLLVGLFAGVIVDRQHRRPILIACDLGRALLLATIPLAALRGTLTLGHLFVIVFMVGFCNVFFDVAYQAYLPSLVPRERLIEANGKLQMGRSVTVLAGPSLAGLLIQIFTSPFVIALDALSFVISAGFLTLIGDREGPIERVTHPPVLTEIRAGFAIIVGDPVLWGVILNNIALNFFISGVHALYVLYATRDLQVSPASLGIVFATGNVGALVSALLVGRLNIWFGFGRVTTISAILFALSYVPVVLATPATALPLLILGQLAFTLAGLTYDVNTTSLGQAIVPQKLMGRFVATTHFLVLGAPVVGGVVAGVIAQGFGSRLTIAAAALGILAAAGPILLSSLPKLDRLGEPEE